MIAASGGSPIFLIVILGVFAFYWFVMRPQKKRQTQQQQMLNELDVGDEVLTAGGIYGTISQIDENEVVVEIAPQLEVRVARRAIAAVTPEPEPEEDEDEEDEEDEEDGEGGENGEAEDPEESEDHEAFDESEEQLDEAAGSSEPESDTTGPFTGGEPSGEENRG